MSPNARTECVEVCVADTGLFQVYANSCIRTASVSSAAAIMLLHYCEDTEARNFSRFSVNAGRFYSAQTSGPCVFFQ